MAVLLPRNLKAIYYIKFSKFPTQAKPKHIQFSPTRHMISGFNKKQL